MPDDSGLASWFAWNTRRAVAEIMHRRQQAVFVVSGDESVRSALEQVLSAHGVHAVAFESAAAYLEYAKPDLPGCLILDVVLPDMCGLELQQRAAAACSTVLFVTRRAEIADSVCAMKAGALDFLTLPLKPHALLLAVGAALDLDKVARAERERATELRRRLALLSPREREVLPFVVGGILNKQSAAELGIAEVTIQVHRRRIMQKMRAASFADLVRIAYFLGIPAIVPSRPASTPYRLSIEGMKAGSRMAVSATA